MVIDAIVQWPTADSYVTALQNPGSRLRDAELKSARVDLDKLGLPRAMTGASAIVFKLSSGNKRWALRCFLRGNSSEAEHRYDAIARYLASGNSRYFTDLSYVGSGVRVGAEWVPVVKMTWVDGEPLATYIARQLKQPAALSHLAVSWVEMCEALEAAHIVHGDLQHGNVLVVNGQPTLVDYDGLQVPNLQGHQSNEIGHPNYQHPRRTPTVKGPARDRFSEWVVYLSLVALVEEPSLWKALNGGDECLLLRAKDFASPASSRAFSLLANHQNTEVRTLAKRLMRSCSEGPAKLPALAHMVTAKGAAGDPTRPLIQPTTRGPFSARWYATQTIPTPILAEDSPGELPDTRAQTWVPGLIQRSEPGSARPSLRRWAGQLARVATGSFALAVGIAAAAEMLQLPARSVLLVVGTLLAASLVMASSVYGIYRREAAVASRAAARRRWRACKRQADKADSRIRFLAEAIEAVEQHHRTLQSQTKQREAQQAATYRAEVAAAEQAVKRKRSGIAAQVLELARERDAEKSLMLRELQSSWIENELRRLPIADVPIPDLRKDQRRHLAAHGIRSAADIEPSAVGRIPGLGRAKTRDLMKWRRQMERNARFSIPTSLPSQKERQIDKRYERAVSRVQAGGAAVERNHRERIARLDANKAKRHASILRDRDTSKRLHDIELARTKRLSVEARIAGRAAQRPLADAESDLRRYEGESLRRYLWRAWLRLG
jgi:hypothetical protein